ncbi:PLP-dependent aminotransferase family protein [Kocuria palustris]|uniref:MocR-like pyridoxine biosynthesis transcription factor PdxR n=1 Tax=Kocuria palustris TaxID=71999 RepID=UPI0011A650AB|nr:PLP-dependent aminotransferase family protein [Kocuria palustris]
MTARSSIDLSLPLDRADERSLPVQIADALRTRISDGRLRPGDPLPSSRFLAMRHGISRGTVVAAFDQLAGEGFLLAAQGRPTVVHPDLARIHPPTADPHPGAARAPSAPPLAERPIPHPITSEWPNLHRFDDEAVKKRPLAAEAVRNRPVAEEEVGEAREDGGEVLLDLRPGQPDTSRLEGAAWRAAWRHAAAQPLPVRPDPAGQEALRRASAEHLRLMRALPAQPDRLAITAGAREGLSLLLGALAARTGRARLRVGVESPGYPTLRAAVEALGHERVPCPVDDDGLRIDLLPAAEEAPDALIVTPSHQYPLGGSLGLQRRLDLLEWAQDHDVLLIEDDFDSELRYVGAPLPALSALDRTGGSVALLGTFSALLSPALATGYLVLPEPLLGQVLERRRQLGVPVSALTQTAIAHLLDSGYLRRHTRRMRSVYARRRDRVVEAFAECAHARLAPMHGGVDALITTAAPGDAVARRCREAGLLVGRRSAYWAGAPAGEEADGGEDGVVVGFARADEQVLRRVLPQLVAACDAPTGGSPTGGS